MINPIHPTSYPEINAVLRDLLAGVQAVLGDHLVGMYLEGSLANGDFDESSDIDFVVVTDVYLGAERAKDLFAALYNLHVRIAAGASPWVIQLEGSYLSQHALRRYDLAGALHPNIERGVGERLKSTFWFCGAATCVLDEQDDAIENTHVTKRILPMMNERTQQAVYNNAVWCDTICHWSAMSAARISSTPNSADSRRLDRCGFGLKLATWDR